MGLGTANQWPRAQIRALGMQTTLKLLRKSFVVHVILIPAGIPLKAPCTVS